jgi:DNA-binding CsgD family transcriptional regulator
MHNRVLRNRIAASWRPAFEIAGDPTLGSQWASALAREVQIAAGVLFADVTTTVPGNWWEQHFACHPQRYSPVLPTALNLFAARMITAGYSVEGAIRRGDAVSAPFDGTELDPRAERIREEIHRSLMAPHGFTGYAMTYVMGAGPRPMAMILTGAKEASPMLLRELRPQLDLLRRVAARTLRSVYALAGQFGARFADVNALPLTFREQQIAHLAMNGSSDARIGRALGVSEHTVGAHLNRIFRRLGVHSRMELAARARSMPASRLLDPLAALRPVGAGRVPGA